MSSNHRGRTRIRGAAMWLLLLELRTPLITLIITYSISVLGLVLILGMTSEATAYHLSFLDAFYVVSYTATTIGFGETPHPFTSEQKLWMLVVMYSTVISWLYAIGSVLSVISDPAFRRLRAHQRAVNRIASQKLPFWIVCGFGGAGSQLIRFQVTGGRAQKPSDLVGAECVARVGMSKGGNGYEPKNEVKAYKRGKVVSAPQFLGGK